MLRKMLLSAVVLLFCSVSVYAACPALNGSYTSKHQEYLCKRYVTIIYNGAAYRVDFSQIQTVFQNTHGYANKMLTPAPPWPASENGYFVVFNNSTWLVFGANSNPKPADAWDAYRDFLIENPSFIGMR